MNRDGDILRRMIRDLELSQDAFSRLIGISPRMLENYLNGEKYKAPKKIMLAARWIYLEKTGDKFKL
jgi:transcriptional regulator with XRE-family HTH domain